ncbi:putative Calmodulin-binding domain, plant [Medicago truncatula]|uniref:Plant calmodulin-binding-like protein n=1 Tax=Medicago truncatula TaxID=3880 RepID=A0A072URK3_MEDTR|nr:AT-rich interactive domain-containing protein 4B [Medicago truncatula]KEH31981.1 plant calmodulin-binding-like protein [Medicago truncatula]RHN63705.1 putative Calmodulin-binding domain, plant [Medicago truncatula]
MAEEIIVYQVESEKIEAEDDDKKKNPTINQVEYEKIIVNQAETEPEKIEAENDEKKANPTVNQVESEKITVNQVEPEKIEAEDDDDDDDDDGKKANPTVNLVESEKITGNQIEPEKIEAEEDDDKKATPTLNQVESEKIIVHQVETEKIEAEDDDDKKTNPTDNQVEPEKIEAEYDDKKANPNEGITITKGPAKILSRYLRDRASSCHDLCKYGIQHATETKPWSTSQKRRERKTNVSGEIVISLEGTKKSRRSSNASPLASKHADPNYIVDIKEVTNEKTPFEETNVSMEHSNSDIVQASSKPYSLHVKKRSKSQTEGDLVKNKCAFGSSSIKETASGSKQKITSSSGGKDKSLSSSSGSKQKITSCNGGKDKSLSSSSGSKQKITSSSGGKGKSLSSISFLSSKNNIKSPSSLSDNAKKLKRVSSPKNHENAEVKPKLASNDNLPEKILHVIDSISENSSEEPTPACNATKPPSPSPSKDKILKSISKKTGKSEMSASSRKGLKHVGHGTVSGTLSHQSSMNRFRTNIQHKARTVSRPSSTLSFDSSSNSSVRKQNGTTSRPNKTGRKQGENVRVGYKIRPKMSAIVGAANKVIPSRKLTFRRGKVIEIQPQSNNIPRRLKFKPVRLLDDEVRKDVNGTRKRIISNKEVDGGEVNAANIKTEKVDLKPQTMERGKNRSFVRKVGGVDRSKVYGSRSGSEKVVLRHQNVEGKKQNPGLYNNVIEETASKLAQLRKSKVKALVGAFETVISLDSPREATTSQVSTVC